MNEIKIKTENIEAAYKVASDETKKVLDCLFAHENIFVTKPNLDDYKSIKAYEDACESLGEEPLPYEPNPIVTLYGVDYEVPTHIIALMKLETISRALWGRTWKPELDTEGSKFFYYPYFTLYAQSEIDKMDEKKRRGLLYADALIGAAAGFGYLNAYGRSSHALACIGFRLCQETEEKAEYFGKQFIELWAEYLQFNFITGDRLK